MQKPIPRYRQTTRGIELKMYAESNKEQNTKITIAKTFKTLMKAEAWFAGRETSIIYCMKELEDVCMD